MTDVFNPELRYRVMKSIRSKNSKAELTVFSYLRGKGIYFQRHYSRVAGKPDIALPRKKKAVFIDGDFWHGRDYEIRLRNRESSDPWVKKITRNKQRDNQQMKELNDQGWSVLRVWESDIKRKKTRDESLEKIYKFLKS